MTIQIICDGCGVAVPHPRPQPPTVHPVIHAASLKIDGKLMWSADFCEKCARKIIATPRNWPYDRDEPKTEERAADADGAEEASGPLECDTCKNCAAQDVCGDYSVRAKEAPTPHPHNHQEGVICEKCDTSAVEVSEASTRVNFDGPRQHKGVEILAHCARPTRYRTSGGGDWIDWPEGLHYPHRAHSVEFQDDKIFDMNLAHMGILQRGHSNAHPALTGPPTHYRENIRQEWKVWPYTEKELAANSGITRAARSLSVPVFAIKFEGNIILSLANMTQGHLLLRTKS